MPASIRYLSDGCWRWHLDYNVAHWEEYDFCPRGTQLLQLANRNSQSWDFGTMTIHNLASFACPPSTVVLSGDPKAGDVLGWSCPGTNTAVSSRNMAATTATMIGFETIRIGGSSVSSIHELQKGTLTGGQRGTVTENWWFAAVSGLPLRVERQITILSSSPIGTITYDETGSWQMISLVPRT